MGENQGIGKKMGKWKAGWRWGWGWGGVEKGDCWQERETGKRDLYADMLGFLALISAGIETGFLKERGVEMEMEME